MIIGINGKIGSGKDTVGRIIQYLTYINTPIYDGSKPQKNLKYRDYKSGNNNWQIKKFAYKLKQITALLTECTVEDLESQEFKNKQLGEEWNYFKGTITDSDGRIQFIRKTPTQEAKIILPFPNRIQPYTYRDLLQRIGTEAMRNIIHEDIWVNALFADYKYNLINPCNICGKSEKEQFKGCKEIDCYKGRPNYIKYPNWIITDLRFPNELKAIEDRDGISIRINRYNWDRDLSKVDKNKPPISFLTNEHPSETALDQPTFKYTIDNDGTIEDLIEKVKEILILEKII